MPIRIILLTASILSIPSIAFANGGGPLLLLVNFWIFLIGQVWIIISECCVYKYAAKTTDNHLIANIFFINLKSTIVVGLGFPFLLALIGLVGSFLPQPVGGFFMLFGTWVMDKVPYDAKYLPIAMAGGFLMTYFLTVYFEARCFVKLWERKGIDSQLTAKKLSWISNTGSYAGLVLIGYISYFYEFAG